MKKSGFTLIELSIVLVIIGLIIGGVLVGRDLIKASDIRAQVYQIEKYRTAVGTFYTKYKELPGDMKADVATAYGFAARGALPGQGDSNGLVQCIQGSIATIGAALNGECTVFWVDLSTAGLIDGGFTTATPTQGIPSISGGSIPLFFPRAKIGNGNFVRVFGYNTLENGWGGRHGFVQSNYYTISLLTNVLNWSGNDDPGITPREAYGIDVKIDDGHPQRGKAKANYFHHMSFWSAGGGATVNWGADGGCCGLEAYGPATHPVPASDVTCYDNDNVNGRETHYSLGFNGGQNLNCLLSIQF